MAVNVEIRGGTIGRAKSAINSFLWRVLGQNVEPIEISTSQIDGNHVQITTTQGEEVHKTIATVFTEAQLDQIDGIKRNLAEQEKLKLASATPHRLFGRK